MISERHNFIFFHIPKAAGTSIIISLYDKLNKNVLINDSNKELVAFLKNKGNTWPNHATCGEIMEFLGIILYENYFKFCFVRNPWDRLVSMYHYTVQKEKEKYAKIEENLPEYSKNILEAGSFDKWIKSRNIGTGQFDIISNDKDELLVDYVGRSEIIQSDFSYICSVIGIENIQLPKSNTSKHKDYRDYYTEETIQIVAEKHKKDIEFFGYEFEQNIINESLQINKGFIQRSEKDTIKFSKLNNLNNWCEIPNQYNNESIILHPNEVDRSFVTVEFFLYKSLNKLFSSIEFTCFPFDKNPNNNGVLLEVRLINNSAVIYREDFLLEPYSERKIHLKFSPLASCKLNLVLKTKPKATSNDYGATRLSPFKF